MEISTDQVREAKRTGHLSSNVCVFDFPRHSRTQPHARLGMHFTTAASRQPVVRYWSRVWLRLVLLLTSGKSWLPRDCIRISQNLVGSFVCSSAVAVRTTYAIYFKHNFSFRTRELHDSISSNSNSSI
jgi:hypothetical protein